MRSAYFAAYCGCLSAPAAILICPDWALVGQGAGEPEVGEGAAVGEPGDGADLVAAEGEDDHPVGPGDRCLGAGEVAAEGGLGVGPGGHQPQRGAAQGGPVAQEGGDGRLALVLIRLGWHGEPGVAGEQGEHGVDVAGLDRGCGAAREVAFAGGV